jgi:hypothetical protein
MGKTRAGILGAKLQNQSSRFECKEHSQFVIPRSCNETRVCYYQCLKALSVAFSIATIMLIAGCADPLEKPLTQEASEKFQRGITGHGTLGPVESPQPLHQIHSL